MNNNNYYCLNYDGLFINRDRNSYGEKEPKIDTKESSSEDDLLDSDDEYQSCLDTTPENVQEDVEDNDSYSHSNSESREERWFRLWQKSLRRRPEPTSWKV